MAESNAENVDRRKKWVLKRLREETGIRAFEPRPNGGSSNTGNVARKALSHPDLLSELFSSEETTVPSELIRLFHCLAVAINCTQKIDPDLLQGLCNKIKLLYYDSELDWFPMCSSVHKILEHSPDALRRLQKKSRVLTLGHLSETPLEVCIDCMHVTLNLLDMSRVFFPEQTLFLKSVHITPFL